MNCPHCSAPLPEPAPRFCDACGLAVPRPRQAVPADAAAPEEEVRCQECGLVATGSRCRGCGAKIRWPEGVEPIDERRPPPRRPPEGQG